MIRLIVKNARQISMLELLLQEANVEYAVEARGTDIHFNTPYLIVDGAPLDFRHSLRWIDEFVKNRQKIT